MYVSTLHHIIKAMGGELKITATFPDGSLRSTNFEMLGKRRRLDDKASLPYRLHPGQRNLPLRLLPQVATQK